MNAEPVALDYGYKSLADLVAPVDFRDIFGRPAPVELEIGAGRGDFMVQYATAQPDVNFMAVERKLVVLRKIVSKVQRAGLSNVQVLNVEVRHFLREYIARESLRAVHVYFPDPWPKRHHAHRRLMVHEENIELIIRSIEPGGHLHFRTDVPGYYDLALQLLQARTELQRIDVPIQLASVKTGYETRFHRQGIATFSASYIKG